MMTTEQWTTLCRFMLTQLPDGYGCIEFRRLLIKQIDNADMKLDQVGKIVSMQAEIDKLRTIIERLEDANECLIRNWPQEYVRLPTLPNVPFGSDPASHGEEVSQKPPQNPPLFPTSDQSLGEEPSSVPNRADRDTPNKHTDTVFWTCTICHLEQSGIVNNSQYCMKCGRRRPESTWL